MVTPRDKQRPPGEAAVWRDWAELKGHLERANDSNVGISLTPAAVKVLMYVVRRFDLTRSR
jgi:hypothetical protein